jgi:hypothetical protein
MHKMRKSEVQLTGCLLQRFYFWNIILMLQKELRPSDLLNKEDSPQIISCGLLIISIISIP